ncbi:ATP-binding cassette domain-containing protein [Roseomonas marmotae]|uniref:ATP-binding cassette domain-containing protein n=1 Tax=Roseomonas marmotae TaxID=2768161 RepID=A0ABS3K790_9PROT|nr:ATP-binding cassette domain-containing protein [Roseomonas marmotae]MBO1073305.1 ATP-binding cassette domain-containing protein [Roseomonas marmotae]QTI79077.1 ATP-binding cassette domain-containing protein [Roseomonas marmotae]
MNADPRRTRPLPPGQPLALHAGDGAWMVLRGEAQVFATTASGLRWSLGAVGPGGLLLGAGLPEDEEPIEALIATGMAGTELMPLDPAALAGLGADGLALMAEGWAALLASGLGRALGPRPALDVTLRPGSEAPVPEGARAGGMAGGLWAAVEEGEAALFGMVPVPALLPLPPHAWLVAETPVRLRGLDATAAMARPGWLEALRALTAACLEAMPLIRGLAEADEANRLRARAELEEAAEAETRARMAKILGDPPPPEREAAGTTADDGLFQAMSLVARAAGLTLRRPPRLREADMDRLPGTDEIARASGIRLRPVRLEGAWWGREMGPLLGRRGGRVVALLPGPGGYRLLDPLEGGQPVTPAVAAMLEPMAELLVAPLPDGPVTLGRLLGFGLRGAAADQLTIVAALLAGALLGQLVPLATGLAFSLLIPAGLSGALVQLGVALGLVAGVGYAVRLAMEVARQRVEARAAGAMQAAIWDRLLRLPLRLVHRFTVADLALRADALAAVPAAARGFAVMLAGGGAMLLSSAAVMLLRHPAAAGAALGMALLVLLVALFAAWRQARAFADGEALEGMADSLVFQFITGIAKLRLAGAEGRALRRWADRFAAMRARSVRARGVGYLHESWLALWQVLGVAAISAILALLDGAGEDGLPRTSLADMVAFLSAYGLHASAAGALARAVLAAGMQLPSWKFARPLLQLTPEPAAGRTDPGRLSGAIEVTGLRFGYEGGEGDILTGLSLKVAPGEFVAITGRSGSGKTTLLRLLLGLEVPLAGSVFYDGHDLRSLDPSVLRQQVGTVLQHGRVAPGSILDAVRGLSGASEQEVRQALEEAALARDVMAMPMGLHTLLTDASRTLSGGQVQRLLIARALAQRPAILLLDEATSALDTATEAAVTAALARLPATRIVIAHRLSTIRDADRILYLENGRVVESGPYDALVAKGGAFARMVAAG